jgi:hypothetical protein
MATTEWGLRVVIANATSETGFKLPQEKRRRDDCDGAKYGQER